MKLGSIYLLFWNMKTIGFCYFIQTNGEILVLEIDILGASFQEPSDRYWFMGVVMMVNQVLSAG